MLDVRKITGHTVYTYECLLDYKQDYGIRNRIRSREALGRSEYKGKLPNQICSYMDAAK